MSGFKRHGIDLSKVIFVVADVGTSVKPGNHVNPLIVETFSKLILKYNSYLKVHSGDYLENLEILPEYN